jgi:hypothetical protein
MSEEQGGGARRRENMPELKQCSIGIMLHGGL